MVGTGILRLTYSKRGEEGSRLVEGKNMGLILSLNFYVTFSGFRVCQTTLFWYGIQEYIPPLFRLKW